MHYLALTGAVLALTAAMLASTTAGVIDALALLIVNVLAFAALAR